MNRWIEEHPQEVEDIERMDIDDQPTRKVARRVLKDPQVRAQEEEEEEI